MRLPGVPRFEARVHIQPSSAIGNGVFWPNDAMSSRAPVPRQHCPHRRQACRAAGLVRFAGALAATEAQVVLAHLGDEARRLARDKIAPLLASLGIADM